MNVPAFNPAALWQRIAAACGLASAPLPPLPAAPLPFWRVRLACLCGCSHLCRVVQAETAALALDAVLAADVPGVWAVAVRSVYPYAAAVTVRSPGLAQGGCLVAQATVIEWIDEAAPLPTGLLPLGVLPAFIPA